MTGRKLSVTLTGPEGMLEAMATLLRKEGYTVVAPVRPPAAGDAYVAALHTYEVLKPLGLGVSYDDPRRAVLVPMAYDAPKGAKRARRGR